MGTCPHKICDVQLYQQNIALILKTIILTIKNFKRFCSSRMHLYFLLGADNTTPTACRLQYAPF